MYASSAPRLVFGLLLWQRVVAEPWERSLLPPLLRRVDPRQSGQDLSFCYGEDSICSVGNDLWGDCESLSDDFNNLVPWYKCVCGNGYVSVEDACYWCQLAYHLDVSYSGPSLTEGCNSASVAIAPIPSSVLQKESAFNASYTGTVPSGPTGSGDTTATGTASGSDASQTSSATKAKSTTKTTATRTSNTAAGEATSVQTLNGGIGPIPPTTASTSPTSVVTVTRTPGPAAGGGPNAGVGWDFKAIVGTSLLAFGFGVAMLL